MLTVLVILVFLLGVPGNAKEEANLCKHQEKALDPGNMDLTVRPGDDFYQYANGNWLKNNPVPPAYSSWGNFRILAECNSYQLIDILEQASRDKNAPKGSNVRKIGDFYAAGMDKTKIEAEGVTHLQKIFKRIADLKDKKELPGIMAYFHSRGFRPLFSFFDGQDPGNSNMTIAWLSQGGLGLPDRDYYLEENERSKKIRKEYVNHILKMFELLKESPEQAAQSAKTVMALETRLAKASMTRIQRRDPKATYNRKTLAELDKMTEHFNFAGYFKAAGLPDPGDINTAQPEFFKEVSAMVQQVSLDQWKTYLRWNLIRSAARFLSSPFANENFRFYGKILSGRKQMMARWKRVVGVTSSLLDEAVGQLYVEKYFPPQAKTRAFQMVMNFKDALGERIKKLDWMSAETKQRALEKLAAFKVKIGYPDKWVDFSKLEVKRDAYILNVMRARYFGFMLQLEKIGKPVDRGEWHMSPQTVNAYYHPMLNEIVFPAAILQPPFFDFTADDAVNYGGIGAAIGHEMTHGFDDQGRKYDKYGNLKDWWTKDDEERFNKRAEVLEKQYDEYVAVDDVHINGKLTLGENIADLGGLSIAYDAFLKTLENNKDSANKKIDGFTPKQRFFLAWAQVWRRNLQKETLLMKIKTDVHSPAKFRTIGPLTNLPIFYEAFDVKPGDTMYRPEKDRVKIW